MPWREALRPVRMRRIAVVAAPGRLRDALVAVAEAGCVEFDHDGAGQQPPAAPAGSGPTAADLLRGLDTGATAPALAPTAPDLSELLRAGDADLLAGEAQLDEHARAAVRRAGVSALAGWCPDQDFDALSQRLAASGAALVPLRNPRGIDPPTLLRDVKPLHRAASPLLRTYGTVPYADVDPTVAAGLAYVAMFGIMFGDVGHGLLLVAGALLIRFGRIPWLAKLRGLWLFIAGAGLAAAAGGLLYGEFFGPTGVVPALWLKPLDAPTRMLAGAIGIGGLLLAAAYLLGIVNRWREGGPGLAVYASSGVAGAVLFAGLAVIGLGTVRHVHAAVATGVAVAVVGLCAVAVGFYAASGGGGAGVAQTGVELFDTVVRIGSNVVSFSRLAAFGLAHAALGAVIWDATTTAARHGAALLPVAVLVFVLGNALAFTLEALVAGVQALRLEFYELFSRVFDLQGRPFRPWKLPVRSPEVPS
ncbi:V-type ATPase 116kDa subunit family protein [Catenulispora subtropica]|uniref:V-type ATP synthase subunit I n=1 Tax=Catenulispora subtropica TaxID=450798 RepID=A0ABN2TEG0_9ACTN